MGAADFLEIFAGGLLRLLLPVGLTLIFAVLLAVFAARKRG